MSLNSKLLPDMGSERLEPDVVKVASPVLRGLGAGNGLWLLGKNRVLLRCNTTVQVVG